LQVHGAQLVPEPLRREVDDLLQHLLRNAVEHGVETPEERLAAGKPASGEMQVSFELRDGRELVMTVRDDGRGFDVQRIGRAAVLSGLLAEESLLEFEPGDVVGLIFKPDFSTEHLEGEAGRGRGMSFLRRTVARLGGDIAVATRPGSYTQFILRLPLQDKAGNSTG
jgi:two-component system chemotaxis sensor kinase CheA